MNDLKYSYDDVSIVPEVVSDIESRSKCKILDENYMLPIFTAPMDTVVCEDNIRLLKKNEINVVIPRDIITKDKTITSNLDYRLDLGLKYGCFVALSMQEAKDYFLSYNERLQDRKYYICIDVANGHMKVVLDIIKNIKNKYDDRVIIMGGNIANPKTYIEYENAGCDYVRCGIGGGSGCFVDGTKVTMFDGTKKNIEDVKTDDMVLTSDGMPHKVTSRTRFQTNKKILSINNEIECTEDHKFYVINKKDKDLVTEDNIEKYAFWVEAKLLDKDSHLLIKKFIE